MSALLWERKARLAIDSFLITDLRIQFKVKKTLKKEPNTCDIAVANLNESSRAQLQKKRFRIVLEAGYLDSIAQLFAGDSRYVDQVLDGATWLTKIQCGDGEKAYRYLRVAESFRPGTRVVDVINAVAQASGMKLVGHVAELRAVTEQFLQGHVAFGKVATELDDLLTGRGFTWSIQDGQLQVLKVDGAVGEDAILLSPTTGLVGSPEHGNPEKQVPVSQVSGTAEDVGFTVSAKNRTGPAVLKAKSLLQPGFRPGRKVKIVSKGTNGIFRIQTVVHTGDTFGGEWYSDLECLPSA
jgi:hypothetical protein